MKPANHEPGELATSSCLNQQLSNPTTCWIKQKIGPGVPVCSRKLKNLENWNLNKDQELEKFGKQEPKQGPGT